MQMKFGKLLIGLLAFGLVSNLGLANEEQLIDENLTPDQTQFVEAQQPADEAQAETPIPQDTSVLNQETTENGAQTEQVAADNQQTDQEVAAQIPTETLETQEVTQEAEPATEL